MNSTSTLITAFVTLIIGVMLVGVVAGSVWDTTGKVTTASSESVNVSDGYNSDSGYMNSTITFTTGHLGVQCGSGAGGWTSEGFVIKNQSGTTLTSGNYTVDYDAQTIAFSNTSTTDPVSYGASFFGGNISSITYGYYPESYVCDNFSRTTTQLIPGFFGLAMLIISVGLFYQVAKENNLNI